eukprot:5081427-Prorocentrum_lima.AAC.1
MVQHSDNKQMDHQQRRNTHIHEYTRNHSGVPTERSPLLHNSRTNTTTNTPATKHANQQPDAGVLVPGRHIHHVPNGQTHRNHAHHRDCLLYTSPSPRDSTSS